MDERNVGPNADPKNSIFETVARYSASRFYRQFLGIFTAYLRPKLLAPQDFGLWNLLRIIPDYVSYSHFGLHSAMRYNVPREKAAGRLEAMEEIQATAFAATWLINGSFSMLIVLIGVFGVADIKASWGLIAMGVSFLLVSIYEFQMNFLKGHEQFPILTHTNYFHVTISFLVTVVFLVFWGIYGLFIAFGLSHVFTIFYIYRRYPHLPKVKFNLGRFKQMFGFGFPIMMLGVVIMLVQTSDRLMISALLGNEQLGYYAISNMIMGFLMNVPGAAREVLEPKLMRELEHTSDEHITFRYLIQPLLNTSYLMPLMVGPVVFCLPVAISILLPRYLPGVTATQILATGGFFFAHVVVLRGIITARNRQGLAARLVLIPLFFNLGGSLLAVRMGFGIEGVATSSLLSYLLVYLLLLGLMVNDLNLKKSRLWNMSRWRLLLPFPAMIALILAATAWQTPAGWAGAPIAVIKTLGFVALMLGLRRVTKMPQEERA